MNGHQKETLQRWERARFAVRKARQVLDEACAEQRLCTAELHEAVRRDEASWYNTPGVPRLPPEPKLTRRL